MERDEAYNALVTELECVSNQTKEELLGMVGVSQTMEVRTSSGKLLTIEYSVSHNGKEFRVLGTAHANNPHKHELLEEQILVVK